MMKPTREQHRPKNNPWEILVVAGLFFFPGLFMLVQRGPLIAIQQGYRYTYLSPSGVTVISAHGAHIFGALAISVSAGLVLLYFYLRCTSPHVVEHGRDPI